MGKFNYEYCFNECEDPIKFIREFKDDVNWEEISCHQTLSEEFIREFKYAVDWHCISGYQTLSEEFIREFKDNVDWHCISCNQTISEEFIREFKDNVNWYGISRYQKLSEEFIREFKDDVDWCYISRYQTLSEEFIREFNIPFAPNKRNCGRNKRNIYVEDNIIYLGCFRGTKEEVIKAINKDGYYSKNPLERDQYIKDVEEVFNAYNK